MAASSDSESKKKESKIEEKPGDAAGGSGSAVPALPAPGSNGATGVGTGIPSAAAPKERDYIWTEDAVHVLLDHFLEKYMSYEKGMIRNADWVEIAQRVNQQLDGNKPVKTPEQCKNKVDNLKKQYRKERRRGSLGPSSTNWAFFSRMHDIFESDYKKSGTENSAAAAQAEENHVSNPPPSNSNTEPDPHAVHRLRSSLHHQQPSQDHYLASREFLRKQQEEMMHYKRATVRRSETPPPPPQAQVIHHPPPHLMLLPDTSHHIQFNHHRDRDRDRDREPPRKKSKPEKEPQPIPQRHHHERDRERDRVQEQNGSSDSGGPVAEGTSSRHERKLHRRQLAELRRDFMEGFTGFAEVMLKIEVAKMEMQRDLERQRAEMELHRTQMMLNNQLQLAKYLKSSPIPHGVPHSIPPDFGFAEQAGNSSSRLQLAIPIFPDFTALDAVGPYEVLHLLPNVEVLFVSHQPGLYAAGMGMLTLQATASFEQVTRPQILVVPGGIGTRRLLQDRAILDWIRKVHEHTLYTASVCTGSLLLGAAGLLKGIEATTHWNAMDTLAEFGAKPVSSRIVRQGKIITSAGVSAGIDMALQLAALLADEATAKTLQLYIEYDPQPPFDSGSVVKAGPDVVNRAKELSSKRAAQIQSGPRV